MYAGVHRAPPELWASAGRRRGQRSNLCGGARRWDGFRVCGTCDGAAGPGCASLEPADGDDLVPGPDLDGEGAGSAAQDGVGAVVERLKGWDDTAPTDPDEGGREEVAWQLGARGKKYLPMSFGGKNMKRPREKGGKCGRKGKKKEERGKKIRKEEAKGKNKCKIGKN